MLTPFPELDEFLADLTGSVRPAARLGSRRAAPAGQRLAPNASTAWGFIANWSGSNPIPTVTCTAS